MLRYTKAGNGNGLSIFKTHIQEQADDFGYLGRHYIGEKKTGSLFDQGRPYDLANLYGSGS